MGLEGTRRARDAASVDAAGASMGSIGLLFFALVVWHSIARSSAYVVLAGATVAWLGVSVVVGGFERECETQPRA